VKKAIHQKTIDFQEAEQEYAKIDTAIIFLVNGLRSEHLRCPPHRSALSSLLT
jgi:hypothetical protein